MGVVAVNAADLKNASADGASLPKLRVARGRPVALPRSARFASAVDVKLAVVQSLPISMWGIILAESSAS